MENGKTPVKRRKLDKARVDKGAEEKHVSSCHRRSTHTYNHKQAEATRRSSGAIPITQGKGLGLYEVSYDTHLKGLHILCVELNEEK